MLRPDPGGSSQGSGSMACQGMAPFIKTLAFVRYIFSTTSPSLLDVGRALRSHFVTLKKAGVRGSGLFSWHEPKIKQHSLRPEKGTVSQEKSENFMVNTKAKKKILHRGTAPQEKGPFHGRSRGLRIGQIGGKSESGP